MFKEGLWIVGCNSVDYSFYVAPLMDIVPWQCCILKETGSVHVHATGTSRKAISREDHVNGIAGTSNPSVKLNGNLATIILKQASFARNIW